MLIRAPLCLGVSFSPTLNFVIFQEIKREYKKGREVLVKTESTTLFYELARWEWDVSRHAHKNPMKSTCMVHSPTLKITQLLPGGPPSLGKYIQCFLNNMALFNVTKLVMADLDSPNEYYLYKLLHFGSSQTLV